MPLAQVPGEVEGPDLLRRVTTGEQLAEVAALAIGRCHPPVEGVERLAAARGDQPRRDDDEGEQGYQHRLDHQQRDRDPERAGQGLHERRERVDQAERPVRVELDPLQPVVKGRGVERGQVHRDGDLVDPGDHLLVLHRGGGQADRRDHASATAQGSRDARPACRWVAPTMDCRACGAPDDPQSLSGQARQAAQIDPRLGVGLRIEDGRRDLGGGLVGLGLVGLGLVGLVHARLASTRQPARPAARRQLPGTRRCNAAVT